MEMSEPVAWISVLGIDHIGQKFTDVRVSLTKTDVADIPLYTSPQKYCPSENNEAYEKGFIDGMAKQRDSAVQRFVESGTPDSELAEHKRIIRQQQAEIEALKAGKIRAYDNGVEDGRKPDTNNELVGYVYSVAGELIKSAKISSDIPNGTPLYTHPVKEQLTDEEIGDFEYQIIRACGLSTANSDINPIGLRQIIKAILRKAQE